MTGRLEPEEQAMRDQFAALLDAALQAEGISDAHAYLDQHGENAKTMSEPCEMQKGGSVYLAMNATIDDDEINSTLQRLAR